MPPVTGLLTLGHRCAVEPEVDLSGHWTDGDAFHVGEITIGNDATVGARTTLLPGAIVGKNADVAPGSGVLDKVKNGQYWKGSPAVKSGRVNHPWPDERPPRRSQWVPVYGLTALLLGGSAAARRGERPRGDRASRSSHSAPVAGSASGAAVDTGRSGSRAHGVRAADGGRGADLVDRTS